MLKENMPTWCMKRQNLRREKWSQGWQLSIPLLSLPYLSSRHRMTKGSPQVTEELSIHMSSKTLAHTNTPWDELCFMISLEHCETYECWSSAGKCASPVVDEVWPQNHTSRRCHCRSVWSGSGCCWALPACSMGLPLSGRVWLPGWRSNTFFNL